MEDLLGALGRVRFVLCRPRNPLNLGAAARALRCAGISRWAVVDPRTLDFEAARRVAVHAEELLVKPQIAVDLPEALQGVTLSIGATARARAERALLTPREAAERLVACSGEVAVVFHSQPRTHRQQGRSRPRQEGAECVRKTHRGHLVSAAMSGTKSTRFATA